MDKLKIGSEEMREAGRVAAAILDLYENKGWKWVQYPGSRDDKSCCLLGAEHVLKEPKSTPHRYSDFAVTPFRRCFVSRYSDAPVRAYRFNDKPGRTYKQVKAALERIIEAGKR